MATSVASAYVDLVPNTKKFDVSLGRALAAAGVGAAIAKFGKDSVKAFSEAQTSQAKLQDAFARFPALADTNIGSLRNLNTELAKKTRFDDDATASGQAVLAQFGLTGAQLKAVTPLLQDYAAKTGKSLPDAAKVLGKAVLGQGKALKNIGINFKDTGSKAGNLEEVMGGLRTQVGGFATKEGATAAGKAEILKNQFGELQETVGSKLLPALTKLVSVGLGVVDWMGRNQSIVIPLVAAIGAAVVVTKAWAAAQAVSLFWLKAHTVGTLEFAAVSKIAAVGTKIWAAAQWLLNAALDANPIGIVIIAIAAVAAGLIYAYQHSEKFRVIVQTAFKVVSAAAKFLWQNVIRVYFKLMAALWLTVAGVIVNGAAKAFGWVPGIGPKLKAAAEKFNKFRDDVNRALDGTKHTVNVTVTTPGMRQALNDLADLRFRLLNIPKSVTVGVGNKLTASGLAGRAAGGPVRAGTPYIVGEHRPEVFVPNVNGTIIPKVPSGGGGLTINGNLYGADARQIVDEQKKRELREAALYPVYS